RDSDNFPKAFELLPDGFLIGEETAGKTFIYDHDSWGGFMILRIEVSTAPPGHPACVEISPRHHAQVHKSFFVFFELWSTNNFNYCILVAAHRKGIAGSYRRNAGQRFKALEQLVIKTAAPLLRSIGSCHHKLKAQHILRLETEVIMQHRREAADHQPGADQQDEGQGDFRDHKQTAQPAPRPCG